MTKSEYRKLLEPQRQSCALVKLLDKYGVGNGGWVYGQLGGDMPRELCYVRQQQCGIHG